MIEKRMIWGNITHLALFEIRNPTLLEGLKTAFPNLKVFEVYTCGEEDSREEMSGMELGVVLKACGGGLGALKHLYIEVPSYPREIQVIIHALLEVKEMLKGK